jgi:hypothetical protein
LFELEIKLSKTMDDIKIEIMKMKGLEEELIESNQSCADMIFEALMKI